MVGRSGAGTRSWDIWSYGGPCRSLWNIRQLCNTATPDTKANAIELKISTARVVSLKQQQIHVEIHRDNICFASNPSKRPAFYYNEKPNIRSIDLYIIIIITTASMKII